VKSKSDVFVIAVVRAMVEDSRHDSAKPDVQDNKTMESSENLANCLGTTGDEVETLADEQVERVLRKSDVSLSLTLQGQECNANSPILSLGSNGDMERALEHQAQLIGRYEAQEKAQRDWEEKCGENNISTPVCCSIAILAAITCMCCLQLHNSTIPGKYGSCFFLPCH